MPDFWQFPTVSMGLGPINSIYQARFMRYLENRGIIPKTPRKIWAFVGDGESDEPETLGAITLASRERLDNLIFVVNCNLQRLDGPVRGNGQIITELDKAAFRGGGLERHQECLWGCELGRSAGSPRYHRPAGQAHGRGRGRRVWKPSRPKTAPTCARNSSDKYPEAAQFSGAHDRRADLCSSPRRAHDPQKVYNAYKRAKSNTPDRLPSSWPRPLKVTAWAKPAKAAWSRTSRRK